MNQSGRSLQTFALALCHLSQVPKDFTEIFLVGLAIDVCQHHICCMYHSHIHPKMAKNFTLQFCTYFLMNAAFRTLWISWLIKTNFCTFTVFELWVLMWLWGQIQVVLWHKNKQASLTWQGILYIFTVKMVLFKLLLQSVIQVQLCHTLLVKFIHLRCKVKFMNLSWPDYRHATTLPRFQDDQVKYITCPWSFTAHFFTPNYCPFSC